MSSTLQHVADLAEVSVSTASRALSGHPAIPSGTVATVQKAAEKLSYVPRKSSRQPKSESLLNGKTIGLIYLGMDQSLMAIPAVAQSMTGAESALSIAGANVQLIQVSDINQVPQALLRKQIDGFILTGAMQGSLISKVNSNLLERLQELPSVWILGRPLGFTGDCVGSNDYATGCKVAEYLVSQGHRQLAFLNPKADHLLFMRREDGFVATAKRLGAEARTYCESPPGMWELPLHAPESVDAVQGLVDQITEATPRPTAIFAATDSVATLVYRALAVRGLQVGKDISVISANNDMALIQGLYPSLTTFDIQAQNLGQVAVQQLVMRMSSKEKLPDIDLTLSSKLIERESVSQISES